MAIYNPDAPRRLPLSRREKFLRAVGAIVLLGTTAWLLANWGSLPVRLPSHYGFGGEIDGWSGRGSLGLLLGIGWGVWLLLAVTRYFPRGWSFSGLPVTDRTRPMLYCLMGEMLTVLQLVIALIFAFLPEFLRFMGEWRLVIFALVLILIMLNRPKGIFGKHEFGFMRFGQPESIHQKADNGGLLSGLAQKLRQKKTAEKA